MIRHDSMATHGDSWRLMATHGESAMGRRRSEMRGQHRAAARGRG